MISMTSSPEKENSKDSPRSFAISSPTSRRKSRKKHRRERSLDRVSIQSNRSSSLTRNSVKSMAGILPKSWKDSFRRKADASPVTQQRRGSRSELSTEESAPGVLKVFGNSVTPGAEYKSVLATQSSTSQELIKEALERYGISRRYATNFVLCDVIGQLTGDTTGSPRKKDRNLDEGPVWTEQCVRVIADHERPLTLQLYWKPMEGYSRRFEIRKRCEIQTLKDTITSGINANARRMLLAKIKPTATLSTDNLYYQIKKDEADNKAALEIQSRTAIDLLSNVSHCINSVSLSSDKWSQTIEESMRFVPGNCPYLLTINHFSGSDLLIHKLTEDEITIGNSSLSGITLFAPDIGRRHCVLLRKYCKNANESKTNRENTYCIKPEEREIVCVNSKHISEETTLNSYDVISIGGHYTFIFKNPFDVPQVLSVNNLVKKMHSKRAHYSKTNVARDDDTNLCVIKSQKENNDNNDISNELVNKNRLTSHKSVKKPITRGNTQGSMTEIVKESKEVMQWRSRRNAEYERDSTRLKIRFHKEKIDSLLDTITGLEKLNPNMYKLSPSYLLCMCVEYSAVKFEQATTRRLLLKMANSIQNEVWVRMPWIFSFEMQYGYMSSCMYGSFGLFLVILLFVCLHCNI